MTVKSKQMGSEVKIRTVFGVAYKANVDDSRESPAIAIIDGLKKCGYDVGIYDPHVKRFKYALSGVEEAFQGSDCAVLVTDHDEFKDLSLEDLGPLMRIKQIIDTRRILNLEKWQEAGFRVCLLGKGE
jgi:UDP-N-acetyl-D-mannosaminuronic acid dehydrogenase